LVQESVLGGDDYVAKPFAPLIFIVVVTVKPLRDFFELVLLRPVDYLVLGLCA